MIEYSKGSNSMKIGIIAEFNPLHNGHLYLINKIKEKYEDASTDLTDSVLSDELEKLYAEWFKEETEEYFSAKEEDYDSPEFQAYLKSFA